MSLLTPARRRGVEYLDENRDPGLQRRSHRDIALANRLFGGIHAVQAEMAPWLGRAGASATLLDVGTGTGDIPELRMGTPEKEVRPNSSPTLT